MLLEASRPALDPVTQVGRELHLRGFDLGFPVRCQSDERFRDDGTDNVAVDRIEPVMGVRGSVSMP